MYALDESQGLFCVFLSSVRAVSIRMCKVYQGHFIKLSIGLKNAPKRTFVNDIDRLCTWGLNGLLWIGILRHISVWRCFVRIY